MANQQGLRNHRDEQDAEVPGPASAEVKARPPLSVVIVSWNGWRALDQCLASVFAELPAGAEVIVFDNGSTDGSPLRVRQAYPEATLICSETNVGHTKAVNQGFRRARGTYVLLLDYDTVLLEGCIETLMSVFEERPDISLAAPRTFNTDGSLQESARPLPGAASGLFGRQSLMTRVFPNNPVSRRLLAREHTSTTEPFRVEQIGGACMFFRRDLLDDVGDWDERYFGYWVDTDWCYRLKSHDRTVACIPTARIIHHEGNARTKRKSPARIAMFHYGAWLVYTRWQTRGPFDPRSILAGGALLSRALLQLGLNATKPRPARATGTQAQ